MRLPREIRLSDIEFNSVIGYKLTVNSSQTITINLILFMSGSDRQISKILTFYLFSQYFTMVYK